MFFIKLLTTTWFKNNFHIVVLEFKCEMPPPHRHMDLNTWSQLVALFGKVEEI